MQRDVFQPQTAVYGHIIRFEILHRQQRGIGIISVQSLETFVHAPVPVCWDSYGCSFKKYFLFKNI
jgi:hypothetical protein